MNILFLDQFSDLGGAQRCLLDLMGGVRRRPWQAHIAIPGHGSLAAMLERMALPVHELPMRPYALGAKTPGDALRFLADAPGLAITIRRLAQAAGATLLYVNGPRLMPAVALARTALPVIFHSHSMVAGAAARSLVRWSLARTRATIVAASRYAAAQWQHATVVYGGVEGPPGAPVPRPVWGTPRVGMIGRFAPQKRQREFCQAAACLAHSRSRIQFVLCGDAIFGDRRMQNYKERALRSAPSELRYLGWCDSVYDVLRDLDLLVLPSAGEGGPPRVMLEAFAAGVPVLALHSGATAEILRDGENGFALPSWEPAEMARRILEVLSAPQRLAMVRAGAHRLWRERFTAERFRAELLRLLSRAAEPVDRCRETPAPP